MTSQGNSVLQVQFEGSEALQETNRKDDVAAILTEAVVDAPLPRPTGLPLVDDWNCLRVSSCMLTNSLLAWQVHGDVITSALLFLTVTCMYVLISAPLAQQAQALDNVISCALPAFKITYFGETSVLWYVCWFWHSEIAIWLAGNGGGLGEWLWPYGSVCYTVHSDFCKSVQQQSVQ